MKSVEEFAIAGKLFCHRLLFGSSFGVLLLSSQEAAAEKRSNRSVVEE